MDSLKGVPSFSFPYDCQPWAFLWSCIYCFKYIWLRSLPIQTLALTFVHSVLNFWVNPLVLSLISLCKNSLLLEHEGALLLKCNSRFTGLPELRERGWASLAHWSCGLSEVHLGRGRSMKRGSQVALQMPKNTESGRFCPFPPSEKIDRSGMCEHEMVSQQLSLLATCDFAVSGQFDTDETSNEVLFFFFKVILVHLFH